MSSSSPSPVPPSQSGAPIKPRFGILFFVCCAAIVICMLTVWLAMTYLPDCCGP